MKNLLVAIDFGDSSRHALRIAQDIARAFGARLHLLNVVPEPHSFWSLEGTGVDWDHLRDTWKENAKQQLAELDVVAPSHTLV